MNGCSADGNAQVNGTVNINTQSSWVEPVPMRKYVSNSNTGANSDRITVTERRPATIRGDEVLIIKMQNDDVGRRVQRVARIADTILFTDRTTGAYDGRNGSVLTSGHNTTVLGAPR